MEEVKGPYRKTGYRMNESSNRLQGQRKPKKMINQNSGVLIRDHSVFYCEFFLQNGEVCSRFIFRKDLIEFHEILG